MLDIIGTLYAREAVEGETPAALAGFHVNTPKVVPEWASFEVVPAEPRRVFAGHPTFFYSFADEAEFNTQREVAGFITQEQSCLY